eukprot:1286011-Alexandrium_andersonii.AAC.1
MGGKEPSSSARSASKASFWAVREATSASTSLALGAEALLALRNKSCFSAREQAAQTRACLVKASSLMPWP